MVGHRCADFVPIRVFDSVQGFRFRRIEIRNEELFLAEPRQKVFVDAMDALVFPNHGYSLSRQDDDADGTRFVQETYPAASAGDLLRELLDLSVRFDGRDATSLVDGDARQSFILSFR